MNRFNRIRRPTQRYVPDTKREEIIDDETDSDEEIAELMNEIEITDSESTSSDDEFIDDKEEIEPEIEPEIESEMESEMESETDTETEMEYESESDVIYTASDSESSDSDN